MPKNQPRIPNRPPEEWTPEVEAIFPIMLPPGSRARGSDFNSILVLAQHPRLSESWLRFNAAASKGFVLSARIKEIAILRVAWRSRSDYKWIQHMLSALREGLTAANFSALKSEDPGLGWTKLERAVIGTADDLWRQQRVGEKAWGGLRPHLTTEQILELLYVVGAYLALAGILNTADVLIEPPILAEAQKLGLPMISELEPRCKATNHE